MTLSSSILMLLFVVLVSIFEIESNASQEAMLHEGMSTFEQTNILFLYEIISQGQCPSNNDLFISIHCRRRVCLPEELISLCRNDGDCSITHKCCRPLCSCRDQCVKAIS